MKVKRGDLVKVKNWTDSSAEYVYGIVLGYVPPVRCADEQILHEWPSDDRMMMNAQEAEVSIQIAGNQYYFYEVEVLEVLSSGSLHSHDKDSLTFTPRSDIVGL